MIRLTGARVYLATLEREDCRAIWRDSEYDFDNIVEPFQIGLSIEKADAWFDDIQRLQGNTNVRLGVFLHDGAVIGDAALQGIDRESRACSLGMGFSRLEYRGRGYGVEAARLILGYAFGYLGLERVSAETLEPNTAARRSLEKLGFVLEGRLRKAQYLGGQRVDRLCYGLLKEEFK